MRIRLFVIAVAVAIAVGPGLALATMLGTGFDGTLYQIEEADGSGSAIGAAGSGLNSAASDGNGLVYSVTNDTLVEIQSDGSSILGAQLDRAIDARGIAFSLGGVLFAIEGEFGFDDDILVTIDVVTGAVATIGSMGIDQVQGLAFAPNGTLYAWDGNAGLLTVDPSTGLATDVNPAEGGTFAIQTIEFAPDGTLYGGNEELFEISVADGTTSTIGSGNYTDVRGLAFLPEPGIGLLTLAGVLTLGLLRRRSCS